MLVQFFKSNLINFFVAILNLFIFRSKKIWLFGAWMGEKFSDNSRFLFQYINENKEKYNIKKVVWITRNTQVYDTLKNMGYEVYYANSGKGFYYHLKAGVHVICNSDASNLYKNDINTNLSFGAKKIQLWHGVGIKACSGLRLSGEKTLKDKIREKILLVYGKPGMWGKRYQLATGKENARVAHEDFYVPYNRIIIGMYPRLCKCVRLLPEEESLINDIIKQKNENKIVLFLPTFRDSSAQYIYPNSIEGFEDFLKQENIIWVQKKHSADKNMELNDFCERIITLPENFDINVLYDYIDLLITDYSSASSDAIFKEKRTLEYCPDYDYYCEEDRGFVAEFSDYHVEKPVINPDELFESIKNRLNCVDFLTKNKSVKSFLFDDNKADYDDIMHSILNKIN